MLSKEKMDACEVKKDSSNKRIDLKFINHLLNTYDINDIESGIVRYYLKTHKISDVKNAFINDTISHDVNGGVYKLLSSLETQLTIYDVEKIFESLICEDDVSLNGIVYTPREIVDYIVSNTVITEGIVCDCSCGCGAFLLGALKRLKQLSGKSIIDIIENNIFGVDLFDYSIRRTKIILSLYALSNSEDKEVINFNLKAADSLNSDWNELFPDIFANGRFDYIVGNPPYVRIQDLNSGAKDQLLAKWETIGNGNFNIYYAFFELGIKLLNKNGKLGYITPNNYFTSLSGLNIRKYFARTKKIVRIISFGHLKLFDASTYTCITFINKNNKEDYFEFCYIDKIDNLQSDLENATYTRYDYKWLNEKKWRLMSENDYSNIKKIESSGVPLGKLCQIRVGIATLKDKIYFVNDHNDDYCVAEFDNKEYLIEKGITRKVVKIALISNEQDIKTSKLRIIFPYVSKNGKCSIMPEEILKSRYPQCYNYLLNVKEILSSRDKGNKSYPTWYAWGRTQGMNFHGPRLYTKTFSNEPNFILDTQSNLFCNGYGIFSSEHLIEIQKILNSDIMQYYIKKTSVEIEGNYQCYQKNFIEKFSIPNFSDEEWGYLLRENDAKKINEFLLSRYEIEISLS